jgi:hypothetical protein
MEIQDPEIVRLVEELDLARDAWIHGRTEKAGTEIMVQADDMTIFGPFGGELVQNGPVLEERQAALSARFHGGTGKSEVVGVMRSGDLVVLVLVERSEVMFDGHTIPQRFVLRSTQVFRKDGERWLRLHRHADPLINRRSFEAGIALAAGADVVV